MTEQNKVILELTEAHLETGLRGVPVGYCPTSSVDPVKGLFYRGYPISELAHKDPEDAIYLLFYGNLPTEEQRAQFDKHLSENSELHQGVIKGLQALPQSGHPMKWLLNGLGLMAMYNGRSELYSEDAIKVVAQLPELVAAIVRIRNGWGDPIKSKPALGYMENFVQMLGHPSGGEHMTELLRVFNVLHMDHGGGNLSTFIGKAVASGQEDMYGSLIGAMAGLAGPLHGMANQECLKFLKRVVTEVGDPTDENKVEEFIQRLWNNKEKLFGFGHAVLRVEDPRATVQYELGEKICPDNVYFQAAKAMRKQGVDFLKKQPKVSNPFPNVDAVSGSLLSSQGLKREEYYTVLFGMSRCIGIAAQIVYEREYARGGKGTPIIRPKYIYSGPKRA
jgi:citrate synthase